MRPNRHRQRLDTGQPTFGTHILSAWPTLVEEAYRVIKVNDPRHIPMARAILRSIAVSTAKASIAPRG